MRTTFILLSCLLSVNFAIAQNAPTSKNGKIIGKLFDSSNNQVLPFASVNVFSNKNAKEMLVGGSSVTETGDFIINNLPTGKLILRISFVGYQPLSQTIELNSKTLDLGKVQLKPDSKMLQEVQIKAEKDQIALGMDKRVFNVDKNLTTVGGTAEAVLRNIPSISMDESGNPSLRNMATTIYINGKPTQLTLAQIPANQIESVEVISNPSARYDASTSGGIVNLVLKKNRAAGFNGTIGGGLGNNNRYDGSLNLNYHEGKWNVTALYNVNSTQNPLNGYVDRINYRYGTPSSYFNQNTDISLNNVFQNGRLALDYDLDNHNTFTLAGSAVNGSFNLLTNQKYSYADSAKNVTSFGNRTTLPANTFKNLGFEFDWKHIYAKKGKELNIRTLYNHQTMSNASDWYTTAQNADGSSQMGYPETDKISGRQIGNQYLAQLDFVQPLSDSSKLEMGLRSSTFHRDLRYYFDQLDNESQVYNLQTNYSQDAVIEETVNAAYVLYNKKFRNKLNLETGLRVEQSFLHGLSRFDNSTFGYTYPTTNGKNLFQAFFPSFSLSKKFNEDSELGFSLSRKVGRPNWRQLFVGIQANDRQNITVGNPNIQPEFVNTAELNYNQNIGHWSWFVSTYYIYEDHTIKPFTQLSTTDPTILITTFINAKADIQYGMDNTFKYSAGSLSAMASINVFDFILQSTTVQNQLVSYRAKANVSYRLPANFTVQINGNRDSKMPTLQGYRMPVQAADFAIRKSFMKNRGSIVFAINDIFNSRKFISVYDQANIVQTTMNRREVRFYKISVQLPIGKPNATFRKKENKENKADKTDIDFNGQ